MLTKEQLKVELGENQVYLPIGYSDDNGLHRIVTLRRMLGDAEEAVTDAKVRQNGGKIITEFLFKVVDSIEGVQKVTKEIIQKLYTADRDYLMLASYIVSFGDALDFTVECSKENCGAENELHVHASSVETKWNADTDPHVVTLTLNDGIKNGLGMLFNVVDVEFPTGQDLEIVSPLLKPNPGRANSVLLSRVVKSVRSESGEEYKPINADTMSKLSRRDRKFINDEMQKASPGADYKVEFHCVGCGRHQTTTIPTNAFLGM